MRLTVKQFVEKRPYLTVSAMRWLLFKRVENGLNMAVVKIGKKILIDEDRYDEWEEKHSEIQR